MASIDQAEFHCEVKRADDEQWISFHATKGREETNVETSVNRRPLRPGSSSEESTERKNITESQRRFLEGKGERGGQTDSRDEVHRNSLRGQERSKLDPSSISTGLSSEGRDENFSVVEVLVGVSGKLDDVVDHGRRDPSTTPNAVCRKREAIQLEVRKGREGNRAPNLISNEKNILKPFPWALAAA